MIGPSGLGTKGPAATGSDGVGTHQTRHAVLRARQIHIVEFPGHAWTAVAAGVTMGMDVVHLFLDGGASQY